MLDLCGCGGFFIALTEEKVGWGDDSKGLSSVPLDLNMQQFISSVGVW